VDNYLKKEKADGEQTEKLGLEKYIKDHNLSPVVTEAGLRYIISKPGDGPKPVAGDTVLVNYTGRLLNGKIFDTNDENTAKANKIFNIQRKMQGGYAPIRFPVGNGQVIKGWDDGLLLLNKGSKAIFLIPSSLGYGERGAGADIGPFSSLAFDIELVDIHKAKPGSPSPGMPQMPNH
jgi:FKBP-type peptidyl-prolyl cis-trans isomerase